MSNAAKNILGVIIVAVVGGLFLWNQHGESTINSYLDEVRPPLLAGDALFERLFTMIDENSDKDDAWMAEQIPAFVTESKTIHAQLQAIETDNDEIASMHEKLLSFAERRIRLYEGFLALSLRQPDDTSPEPDLDGIVAEANAALDEFAAQKAAFLEKYDLHELE